MDDKEKQRRAKLIAENSGGIHPPYTVFYRESIRYAASQALEAFKRYDAGLEAEESSDIIVASVHEAMTHSAALARFFWPVSKQSVLAQTRATTLRSAFNINDNSPLRDKDLRNTLEHYDEKLDNFLLEDHAGNFYPRAIIGNALLNEQQVTHIFRLVDPNEEIFVLLGKRYPFGGLRKEVETIVNRCLGSGS